MFRIGNVEINNKVVLAPMAGISNSAFRRIVKEYGCGLIYAEMVSDKAIVYKNEKTIDMLYMTEFERPIAQQIFGSDKESFVEAAKYIYESMKPDIIDINMGCPVPKVALRSQAGSALLKDIDKIYEIVSAVVNAVPIPVTVKIRSGWDNNNINAVKVAKTCEKAGAKAIAVHARTRSQGYSGKADLEIIKKVKENVLIPVIGNGDVIDCFSAKKMLDYTKCDAVMIGRGCLGRPYVFKEINEYLNNRVILKEPSLENKINICLKHFENLCDLKNEKVALLEIRLHIPYYFKGISNSSDIKRELMQTNSKIEFIKVLNKFLTLKDCDKI